MHACRNAANILRLNRYSTDTNENAIVVQHAFLLVRSHRDAEKSM